jgi:hypothetical protein
MNEGNGSRVVEIRSEHETAFRLHCCPYSKKENKKSIRNGPQKDTSEKKICHI